MNMVFVSNPWTQLLLLVGTGVLCLGMSLWWLGAQHFGLYKRLNSTTVARDKSNVGSVAQLPHPPVLHITSVVQHGRIIELKGATEPGAVVMINGQPAATIFPGNAFKYFLGPVPVGTAIISITCQNEEGGVNTQQLAVTLE
jgi:hypothetical protein